MQHFQPKAQLESNRLLPFRFKATVYSLAHC